MAKSDDTSESAGRATNQWDVAVYALKLLGAFGPYLLVAAVVTFAFYQFKEQGRKIEADRQSAVNAATASYQEQIKDANNAIIQTYGAMADISQKQIKNVDALVELQTKTTDKNRDLQQDYERLRAQLNVSRSEADKALAEKSKTEKELHNAQATLDKAVETLAAVSTLVDTAPELLRAASTTEAVRTILQKSDELLAGEATRPDLRYRKLQILLAFANLQEFVGAPDKQENLAKGALQLIADLRAANEAPDGIDAAEVDADEAAAHIMLGSALGAQYKFEASVREIKDGIRLFDLALKDSADPRATKWRKSEADALELLGKNTHLWQAWRYDDVILSLRKAAEIFETLKNENPEDLADQIAVAWGHLEIAEIERDEQNLDVAQREYDIACGLMQKVGDKVYRNNEWLDKLARIYNGRALLLLERVEYRERALEIEGRSAKDDAEIARTIQAALDDVTKAHGFTGDLARDPKNLAWQSAHAYSLHNLGAVKLKRGKLLLVDSDLEESASVLRRSLAMRLKLRDLAPTSAPWATDLLWTEVNLNEAEADRAERRADYATMLDRFRKNVTLVEKQLAKTPYIDDWHYQHEVNRASYADALAHLKQEDKARETYMTVRAEAAAHRSGAAQQGARDRWEQLIQRVDKAAARLSARDAR
jgi:hypothetical protein